MSVGVGVSVSADRESYPKRTEGAVVLSGTNQD